MPVEVLGLSGVPEAGDEFVVVDDEARAREVTEYRARKRRETRQQQSGAPVARPAAQEPRRTAKSACCRSSSRPMCRARLEAIQGALAKLGTDEVGAQVLQAGVGGITESDVILAHASGAAIIGFNVRANAQARERAKRDGVEIRYYNIIYNVVDDVKAVLSGMLAPETREKFLGNAEILEVFTISKVGKVAGCRVTEGVVRRGAQGAPDPRQCGDPRRRAFDAQALQGRSARGPGRPGMRHGVRQLSGHAEGRRRSSAYEVETIKRSALRRMRICQLSKP